MSDDFSTLPLAEQLRLKSGRSRQVESAEATPTNPPFVSHKDLNGTLGIYLPKVTIRQLKELAFAEGTSVSKIIEELIAPRLLEGPRPKKDDGNADDQYMTGLD